MGTGIIYHEKYREHNLGPGHPERPQRLEKTMSLLENILPKSNISLLKPLPALERDLLRVHGEEYIKKVKMMSQVGGNLDLDTPLPEGTYDIALLAAGGAMLAGESVIRGETENSFALTRPPGHHAGSNFGGGFCFFNNVAVMIEFLKEKHNIKRFMVLDWDVHHGNGTQEIFYSDPSVLYISSHQSPLYPGTGYIEETGEGEGLGYNVNIPLNPGTSGQSYIYFLEEIFIPLAEEFKPEIICISAGYDAYFKDPLASLLFTIETYAESTRIIKNASKKVSSGRIAIVLEGGYNLDAVSNGILATISVLADLDEVKDTFSTPEQRIDEYIKEDIDSLKNNLSFFWKTFKK
jgi:acetoin utilization deacetylase AcuC-like enzyme